MKMPTITKCRECGSTALTWDTHNKNISQAQHGRLTTQDIRCQFVLGCDHCSETLAVVSADQVAAWLTESREASAEPSAPVELQRMTFEYVHADGERHTVALSREEVAGYMDEFLFEKLTEAICHCESIGETNVVDCRCDEVAEQYKLANPA